MPSPPMKVETPFPEAHLRVFLALRRIFRAVEVHSKHLATRYRLTTPQLVCLLKLHNAGPLSLSALAAEVHLSSSTLVGIMDRLERKGLVSRARSGRDRRLVLLSLTEAGRGIADQAPSPLQDQLARGLSGLPWQRRHEIVAALEDVVALMEADRLPAEPCLNLDAAAADEAGRGEGIPVPSPVR